MFRYTKNGLVPFSAKIITSYLLQFYNQRQLRSSDIWDQDKILSVTSHPINGTNVIGI